MNHVLIPQGQKRDRERQQPNRVTNIAPVELVAVEYSDATGIVHKEIWYKVGAVYYQPPGAEAFTGNLVEVKEEFAEQVNRRLTLAKDQVVSATQSTAAALKDTVEL